MEKKYLTCIVCPKGCEIEVRLEGREIVGIIGNACKRGEAYARTEFTAPMRTLTTTAPVEGGGVVPCKTDKAVPKELLFECMTEVNKLRVPRDTKAGDVLLENILGTGANIVATANV